MIEINIHEAKSSLSRLLAAVESRHERVRICRNGKPIALLISIDEESVDPFAVHEDLRGVVYNADPVKPLDTDDWPENMR